jgi:hypothetical protein
MTKATAPMTGGIICAPFEAQASIAAASRAGMPERFISGMVTTPTARALAAAIPETLPNMLEPTTAILAAPPRKRPIRLMARSLKKPEPPERASSCPMKTNAITIVVAISSTRPRSPLVSKLR